MEESGLSVSDIAPSLHPHSSKKEEDMWFLRLFAIPALITVGIGMLICSVFGTQYNDVRSFIWGFSGCTIIGAAVAFTILGIGYEKLRDRVAQLEKEKKMEETCQNGINNYE